ncbi:MAG: ZIP family metal transporter [Acidobacteriota bacterium]|nr:ZIP family metal transporter [Acidobacteriota bacterium]
MTVLAAFIALATAFASIALASGRRMRFIVPASGLLLAGVALFGLIPELAGGIGWAWTLLLATAGYALLHLLDHRGYAVCPSCSHGEKFAGSLVAATAVHAFVDGWGIVAVGGQGRAAAAITLAILLHKAPEGFALGAMLRASTPTVSRAVVMCLAAELPTIAGGGAGRWATPPEWADYMLAFVSGTFLFLGSHAITATRAVESSPAPTEPAG